MINEEMSSSTLNKYITDITVFMKWCGQQELFKNTVLQYKQELIEKYSPATVNSVLSSLNSFFTFNEWHDLKVKTLKIQKQVFANNKELTKAEYKRLLSAANQKKNKRLYYLMLTICSAGIRVSEHILVTVIEAIV